MSLPPVTPSEILPHGQIETGLPHRPERDFAAERKADNWIYPDIVRELKWSADDYNTARRFGTIPPKAKYGCVFMKGAQYENHSRNQIRDNFNAFRAFEKRLPKSV